MSVGSIVFDLDGVLVDSEQLWDRARRELVAERGGSWRDEATQTMMGMSTREWSRYMHDALRVDLDPAEISAVVVDRLEQLYRQELPLLPGARDAVTALATIWPLGLASSANREVIDLVLELAELESCFDATVSSEDKAKLEQLKSRLAVAAVDCAAVEDSTNGLRAAAAAGMTVIALPNPAFPPTDDALRLATAVIHSLDELRPTLSALRD